ncbi:LSM domain-containing protein [Metarhizium rileyi]|uniref:LSM domain-containing protein n=1 Tax=Metarhizium rileyi (strain RCEF 4871) TaxID=1649241 RepID=A0A167GN99_METRR|nr:LSM domain-containing protein [Metarhizium rileyi RCEF 4871]TWU75339.1 hypothetical protein ED733_006924 [Metarhizium rileyi]
MDRPEAHAYLCSLLNQNFRVYTTDGRLFRGNFKCTDPDKNIILANTHEYRRPSRPCLIDGPDGSSTPDMTSRFLGLVVVPGRDIVKMELEQFASQMSG